MIRAKQEDRERGRLGRYLIAQRVTQTHQLEAAANVGVFCGSWEPRSLEWSDGKITLSDAVILKFGGDDQPEKIINTNKLIYKLSALGVKIKILEFDSVFDTGENLRIILDHISARANNSTSSIFIEGTTLPRAYLQKLTHALLRHCMFARVVVGYAPGNHIASSKDAAIPVLTSGSWALASVTTGRSTVAADAKNVLMILLGAETEHTLDLVRSIEPHEVRLLTPSHISASRLDQESQRCSSLVQSDKSISRAVDELVRPHDLLHCLRTAVTWTEHLGSNDRMTFCGLGPKPLCLTGVLLHLSGREIDVLTRIPTTYNPSPTKGTGRYNLYEVVDLCHPACRLLSPSILGIEGFDGAT